MGHPPMGPPRMVRCRSRVVQSANAQKGSIVVRSEVALGCPCASVLGRDGLRRYTYERLQLALQGHM